ncbi:hypothetical protein XBFM1_170012 [Xenorhabdus bovienii str. feltiae Moldova]|uniref:Uncharacterized protein n=1 Tax=Xenorhabdus bovienii str. feltiae Moldova TaxID=1398200 RepID=A0A077NE88_XENBV|nr:hypothetical protein XBFM1_170012 [Xenorhabdus bovienii str. feltiae Moldova]
MSVILSQAKNINSSFFFFVLTFGHAFFLKLEHPVNTAAPVH